MATSAATPLHVPLVGAHLESVVDTKATVPDELSEMHSVPNGTVEIVLVYEYALLLMAHQRTLVPHSTGHDTPSEAHGCTSVTIALVVAAMRAEIAISLLVDWVDGAANRRRRSDGGAPAAHAAEWISTKTPPRQPESAGVGIRVVPAKADQHCVYDNEHGDAGERPAARRAIVSAGPTAHASQVCVLQFVSTAAKACGTGVGVGAMQAGLASGTKTPSRHAVSAGVY